MEDYCTTFKISINNKLPEHKEIKLTDFFIQNNVYKYLSITNDLNVSHIIIEILTQIELEKKRCVKNSHILIENKLNWQYKLFKLVFDKAMTLINEHLEHISFNKDKNGCYKLKLP